jgi:hypothetical protein
MAEPLAVAWSDLSTSSKSAFGWAAAAAAPAQRSKDPRVGSGALLFGVMQADPSNSEPLQLLEHYGGDRKLLMDLAQAMSRERSPFTDSVSAPLRTEDFPEHSQGVSKALEETRRLFGKDPGQGGVSLAHLFGGLLLTNATASKAVGEALREKVTLEELRRGYLDYLETGQDISYRRFLEPAADEPHPPDMPAAPQFGAAVLLGTLGGAGNDSVGDTDQLNFHSYVDAFASLIASPHTAPPLTIGIFGSWGMGKSFLLEHIDREIRRRQDENPDAIPHVHIVRFNAWEYSATEVVWPALVRKIVEKLDQDVPWPRWRRAWTRFKWNLPRALRHDRTAIATVGAVAAVAFVVALARGYAGLATGIVAIVGVLGVSGLAKAASNPVARWVTTLFTSSDYGGQIAHMDEIKHDLETLEKRLHDKEHPEKVVGRILILIDDLDRCEPEKAVEMLQAINLLLNFKSFIVCLGIDARIVTGAIEKHYDGLLGRTGASGYEYLDKIVQIPFRIPEPNPDEVKAFIGSQLGDPRPDTDPRPTTSQDGAQPDDSAGAPNEVPPVAELPTEPVPPPDVGAEQDAVPFSYAELQAFETFAALMRPNPRHLKRMVNVYRLVRTLARSNADEALLQNPAAMIRWLVMWGQWPYASLRMLECSTIAR